MGIKQYTYHDEKNLKDQWSRIERSQVNCYIYDFLFLTRIRNHSVGERTVFSTNGAGKLDVHMEKNEVGPLLYTTDKIHSKKIKDLNVKAKIIKLL